MVVLCIEVMISIHIMHWTDACARARFHPGQHREGITMPRMVLCLAGWLCLSRLSGIGSNASCEMA